MRSASPSIGCATVAASAIRSSTRPTGSRSNARIRRSSASTALEEGKKVEYRKLPLAELREADHLFMTHGGWAIPVCELDGRPYEVDAAQVEAINDAMHTGRTHDLALTIGPSGDYEF